MQALIKHGQTHSVLDK